MRLTTGQHETAVACVMGLMVVAVFIITVAGIADAIGPGAVMAGIAGSLVAGTAIAWALARRCEGCGKR